MSWMAFLAAWRHLSCLLVFALISKQKKYNDDNNMTQKDCIAAAT